MKIMLKRLAHGRDLALPHYAPHGAAGLDLIAAVEEEIKLQLRKADSALSEGRRGTYRD